MGINKIFNSLNVVSEGSSYNTIGFLVSKSGSTANPGITSFTVRDDGSTGVNTILPTAMLTVSGDCRITTLPTGGDLMVTSDLAGNLYTQPIPGFPDFGSGCTLTGITVVGPVITFHLVGTGCTATTVTATTGQALGPYEIGAGLDAIQPILPGTNFANAQFSNIQGGVNNLVQVGSSQSNILGGRNHRVESISFNSSIIGGIGNVVSGSALSIIASGQENEVNIFGLLSGYGAILNGFGNRVRHQYSVIMGGGNITTDRDFTVFMRGLDVDTSEPNPFGPPQEQPFRYHGVFANPGPAPGKILTDSDGLGNAVWMDPPYPPQDPDCPYVSAYTTNSGCILHLINCSGDTFTADTCNTFGAISPYEFRAQQSISTVLPDTLNPSVNHIVYNQFFSNIQGGDYNKINTFGGAQGGRNAIGGGKENIIGGPVSGTSLGNVGYSNIGGGYNNHIKGNDQSYMNIGGGRKNIIFEGAASHIGGGNENIITASTRSFIGGGESNHIRHNSDYGVIGGGVVNYIINNDNSFIGGGAFNEIYYSYSIIGGGRKNIIGGAGPGTTEYAGIFAGSGNTITRNAEYAAIVNGSGNLVNTRYSAIIGGQDLTTNRPHTTFTEGLDVDSNRGGTGNTQAFKYHGTFASPGINRVLTDIDGLGNAVWRPNGIVNDPDCPIVSAFTTNSGCTLHLINCSGDTFTADTCNQFGSYSPYEIGAGLDAIQPILPLGVLKNLSDGARSNIGGGISNYISSSSRTTSIVGGEYNVISASTYSFIGGGYTNKIFPPIGASVPKGNIIVGGSTNIITASQGHSTIVGGFHNMITGYHSSFIGGGRHNQVYQSAESVIVGGSSNYVKSSKSYNFLGGGSTNIIGDASIAPSMEHNVIVGGENNQITDNPYLLVPSENNFIGGGGDSKITGSSYSFIGGGQNNEIYGVTAFSATPSTGTHSIIGGGQNNIIGTGEGSMIGAGYGNTIKLEEHAFIGGGSNNTVQGPGTWKAFIGAGAGNQIEPNQPYSSIVGGINNIITKLIFSGGTNGGNSILGGQSNTISGTTNSSIINGSNNLIIDSWGNMDSVAIIGGSNIVADRDNTTFMEGLDVETNLNGPARPFRYHGTYANHGLAGDVLTSTNTLGDAQWRPGGVIWTDGCPIVSATSDNCILTLINCTGGTITADTCTSFGMLSPYEYRGGWDSISTALPGIGTWNENYIDTTLSYSNIQGGASNSLNSDGQYNAIGGGDTNFIGAGGGAIPPPPQGTISWSNIGGGSNNQIRGLDNSGDVISGGRHNVLTATTNSVISGGLSNRINNGERHTIGGGAFNRIYEEAYDTQSSTIAGGENNTIYYGNISTIAGGDSNTIEQWAIGYPSVKSFIGGGVDNLVKGGHYSSIVGGQDNRVLDSSIATWTHMFIGGGKENLVYNSQKSSIVGGEDNSIIEESNYSGILAGFQNTINANSSYGAIVNGSDNTTQHIYSAIIGGANLTTNRTYTTFMEGLDVDTNRQSPLADSQAFKYHGTFANEGMRRVLTDFDGFGNAKWMDPPYPPQNPDCPIMSAYTTNSGCTLHLIDCSGNTFTASTCNTFTGPYRIGSGINSIEPTIAGLGASSAAALHSNVQGGYDNDIDASSTASAIVGGVSNKVVGSLTSFIGGGQTNKISGSSKTNIVGGQNNTINDSYGSFIGGGSDNSIKWNSPYGTISNGQANTISASTYSSIQGGTGGVIEGTLYGSIVGGQNNHIHSADLSTIVNGYNNHIKHNNSAILGTANRTTLLSFTTYLDGLDVDSVGQGGARYLKYHGALANPGPAPGKILTDSDGLGNAVWMDPPNPPQNPNCPYVSAFTTNSGCTLHLVNCTGGTFTADTCNTFGAISPYQIGTMGGLFSIEPVMSPGSANAFASSIGGGSANIIQGPGGWNARIGGGGSNSIFGDSAYSYIGAGNGSVIENAPLSAIIVGSGNMLRSSTSSFIGGGATNYIGQFGVSGNEVNFIGAGHQNSIMDETASSSIVGGYRNSINNNSDFNFIGGGHSNRLGQTGVGPLWTNYSSILGGKDNEIAGDDNSHYAAIVNGSGNTVEHSNYAAIIGGRGLTADRSHTTFMQGLDVNTDHDGVTRPFTYHGTFANEGINRILTSVDNFGNAVWIDPPSPPQNPDCPYVSAYTTNSGCILHLVNCTGGTFTADTCNTFGGVSPYTIGAGIDSIEPVMMIGSANANYSNVQGGQNNLINSGAPTSSIVGGQNNTINNGCATSFIGNGYSNTITTSSKSSIVGGQDNVVIGKSDLSSIVGGLTNMIFGGTKSIIGAGDANMITGTTKSIIGAGENNKIFDNEFSNISAGKANKLLGTGFYNDIGAGTDNVIKGSSSYSSIAAGQLNLITNSSTGNRSYYSFIGAGERNTLSGASRSTIVSGKHNKIIDTGDANGAILTGEYNLIKDSEYTAIVNGRNNTINGVSFDSSAVIGADDRVVDRDHTTFMEGLDVDTQRGAAGNAQAFKYHGQFASPATNRILTSVDNLGNAQWRDSGVMYLGDEVVVSAQTSGCILTLTTNSGNTITANTCTTYSGPYVAEGANSIRPVAPGGLAINNTLLSSSSNISGGYSNRIGATSDRCSILGGNGNIMSGVTYSTIVGGALNSIKDSMGGVIVNGAGNKILSGVDMSAIIGTSSVEAYTNETTYMGNQQVHGKARISSEEYNDTNSLNTSLAKMTLDVVHDNSTITSLSADDCGGEIVRFGDSDSTYAKGKLVQLRAGAWGAATATGTTLQGNMLGIALGSVPWDEGVLIRGFFHADTAYDAGGGWTGGLPLYVHTGPGQVTPTVPSASSQYVRNIGYVVNSGDKFVYFNPESTYIVVQ